METVLREDLVPPEFLKEALLSRADELSMLPAVAVEALELAKDPDCTPNQFASVIERDVKLATDILSLANSIIFSSRQPVTGLQQAIVRLGFRQCRNLILSTSAASLMKSLPLEEEWIRELLWQHSFVTATSCMHLNRSLGLGYQGEEFTAGLLHDFGRLLMALAAPELFSKADPLDFHESDHTLEQERRILGVDHCCFGAWFAEYNGLPESLAETIRYHHEPHVDHPEQKLTAIVAAGDHLANHLQATGDLAGYEPSQNAGVIQLARLTSDSVMKQFVEIAPTVLEEVLKDVSSTTSARGA